MKIKITLENIIFPLRLQERPRQLFIFFLFLYGPVVSALKILFNYEDSEDIIAKNNYLWFILSAVLN